MSSFIGKYKYELLALLVLLIYLSPNIFFPEKARYLIHDNLDSNVVWYKNLAESGKMFAGNNEIVPNSLGGIPRGCYPSEWNIMHLLYLVFSPIVAYNINAVLMHVVAFIGMLCLLKKYFPKTTPGGINVFISLLFALLPFWPSGGLAIAGQPLLIYAFLNIFHKQDRIADWLIVGAIPFYSLLALSNIFLLVLITGAFLFYTMFRKTIHWKFVMSLALFITFSVFAEWRLFYMQFVEHFESHRDQIRVLGTLNLKGLIGVSMKHFLFGQYHFHSLHFPLLLSIIIGSLFYCNRSNRKIIILSLMLLFLFSLVLTLPSLKNLESFFKGAGILNKVTLRFYSLFPLAWFCLFIYSMNVFDWSRSRVKITLYTILSVQLLLQMFSINALDYQNCDFSENTFYRTYIDRSNDDFSSFDEYYRPELFRLVKEKIEPSEYSICVGISPEIIHYNGIHSVDGYFYYYSKIHYLTMKRINERIRIKNEERESGNLCNLLIPELNENSQIIEPEWNFEILDSMKVINFISKYEIISNQLVLADKFVLNEYPLFLYKNKIN